jgi:hypothetical protein
MGKRAAAHVGGWWFQGFFHVPIGV